jgi:hypothetical protein
MLCRKGQQRRTFILRPPKEVPWIDSYPIPSVQCYYPFLSFPFSSHLLVALPWRAFVNDCFGLVNMCQANRATCRRGENLSTITFNINGTSYGDCSIGDTIRFRRYFKTDRSVTLPLPLEGAGSVAPTSSTVGGLPTQACHRSHEY